MIRHSQSSLLVYADTTDVQKIIVVPLKESNAFVVQCIFLTGSIAQGCKVVLMSEFDSITVNLTRNSWCAADTIEANLPVSNYSAVFGHDIESDGSIHDWSASCSWNNTREWQQYSSLHAKWTKT